MAASILLEGCQKRKGAGRKPLSAEGFSLIGMVSLTPLENGNDF
jgi:hypothetical protein